MIEVHIRHGEASAETGWGLTKEGRKQVGTAAAYLPSHFSEVFSIGIHSGSRRAAETARLVSSGPQMIVYERLIGRAISSRENLNLGAICMRAFQKPAKTGM
jgi:broad specificity phosphatase PhoE